MIEQKGNNKKVLIMVPAQAIFKKERTGVEEYLFKVLDIWSSLEPKDTQFRIYLKHKVKNLPLFLKKDFLEIKIIRSPCLWTIGRLSLEMLKIIFQRKFSACLPARQASFRRNFSEAVLFAPTNVMPLIHPKRTIVTIHGLEYEYFPQYYSWFSRKYLRWSTRYATKYAFKIITVSENTKRDLMKLYKCPSEKIEVIYHGIGKEILNNVSTSCGSWVASRGFKHETRDTGRGTMTRDQFQNSKFKILNSKYFLYLGRIELKKNVIGILEAFERFKIQESRTVNRESLIANRDKSQNTSYKLVLVGGKGYGYENVKCQMSNIKGEIRKDIIFTGHVGGENKWELLRNATALVFPSFYEGFGLPILEAQSVGVPVITSKGSSMEEITSKQISNSQFLISNQFPISNFPACAKASAGRQFSKKSQTQNNNHQRSSALLVDPNRPEEIAEAMGKIINNQKLRDELIRLGYENVKRFSWEKTAQKTLKVLNF